MDTAAMAEKLTAWIKEKVTTAGCKGIVLGMSGGLDSSVLAVLCRRALPRNTLGVMMPCHSQPEDRHHAEQVAGKFGIETSEVVLDGAFDALLKVLPDYKTDAALGRLARTNLKARLRMLTLYHAANQLNYMVAGSGNRSEIAVGYFTKYGDSGVDILPLGNLVKGEVTELAHSLGIPREIIDKPPSAGLWDGQTDEGEMGFSYEALDRYLLQGEAPEALREKIDAMIAASGHKRLLPPIAYF
jgi:NAD+ synthase